MHFFSSSKAISIFSFCIDLENKIESVKYQKSLILSCFDCYQLQFDEKNMNIVNIVKIEK